MRRWRLFPLLALLSVSAAPAEEVVVLSSNGTRAVLEELAPEFEKTSGVRLVFRFAPSAELKTRIENGERFDMAFLTEAAVGELIRIGKADGATRTRIARSGAGVAIRKGARKPDLETPEAFRRALLEAESIAYVGRGATADIVRGAFTRLGIEEAMRGKTRELDSVTAAEAVASGDAQLGFTQVSEILPHPGVELAGPFPRELQVYTTFEAVLSSSSREPDASRRWIRFLTAPDAVAVIRAKGMEPGGSP
jgi:molybdate transport system substrate-binding protein